MEWVKKMIHNVEFSKISLLRLYSMNVPQKKSNFTHRFVSPLGPVSHMNGSLWQRMEIVSGPEFIPHGAFVGLAQRGILLVML